MEGQLGKNMQNAVQRCENSVKLIGTQKNFDQPM